MITIKVYADSCGKTPQAVYKQLKAAKNKDRLKGHIVTKDGKKYLDDIAVAILDESRENAVTVYQETNSQEVEHLKEENNRLKDAVISLQEELLKNKELLLSMKDKDLLIEKAADQSQALEKELQEVRAKYEKLEEELQEEKEKTWVDKLLKR